MKNNVIPRRAKKLEITFKRDVGGHKAGDTTVAERTEWGYWSDGRYRFFVSMLRDPDDCALRVIE